MRRSALQIPELASHLREQPAKEHKRNGPGRVPLSGGPHQANAGKNRVAHQVVDPPAMRAGQLQVFLRNREVVNFRATDVRQFGDFDLAVPSDRLVRGEVAPTDAMANASEARCDGKEAGRYFDDQVGDDAAEKWNIAQKLNGIAEAVQTTEDHPAAL